MIIGIGIDLVEIERIKNIWQRYGFKFAQRILHASELSCLPQGNPVLFLAGRFAAKEAAVKALGTGFSQGIGPAQVETVSGPGGKPNLLLHGEALQQAQAMGVTRCHVSISHDRSSAVAVVVLES